MITKKQVAQREALRLKLRGYYKSVSDAMISELKAHGITTADESVVSKYFSGKYKGNATWLKVIRALIVKGRKQSEKAGEQLDQLIEL